MQHRQHGREARFLQREVSLQASDYFTLSDPVPRKMYDAPTLSGPFACSRWQCCYISAPISIRKNVRTPMSRIWIKRCLILPYFTDLTFPLGISQRQLGLYMDMPSFILRYLQPDLIRGDASRKSFT